MARPLSKRLDELERQADSTAPVLLIVEPGEPVDRAVSRYEAKHGTQPASAWLPIDTGVPRGDTAWCA